MSISFRHSAGFGKRMEYKLVGDMLMEGLDCYLPLVDDHGVDCVIKKSDGTFIEVQIKARSNAVTEGDAALFAAIIHDYRPNFYFVFYSERMDMMWILSSEEFLKECVTNQNGKNAGVLRDVGFIPGSERSPEEGLATPSSILAWGETHGQRSLVGYSLQSHKELDMT